MVVGCFEVEGELIVVILCEGGVVECIGVFNIWCDGVIIVERERFVGCVGVVEMFVSVYGDCVVCGEIVGEE